MSNKIIGYLLITCSMFFIIFSSIISLSVFLALSPFAFLCGAVRGLHELFGSYPNDVVKMLGTGLKMFDVGIKKLRGGDE